MKPPAKIFMTAYIVSGSLFSFIACKETEKKQEEKTEAAAETSQANQLPAYDAALDPINVEAKFLKLHKDTLGIKLYEVTLNPGDSVGIHNHPDHVLYVSQGGSLRLYSKEGKSQDVDLPTGAGTIIPAETHYGLNIGTTPIKLVVADVYRPRN